MAMSDGFSLDQVRAFLAAVDEGNFSAAARKLGCTQSAVSDLIKRLEEEIGVQLFSRATRSPSLTTAGKLLVADARGVAEAANKLNARAHGMALGTEPELCVVVDGYFPFSIVAEASREFHDVFPHVPLRLYVEVLGGAMQPVVDRRASFAVVGGEALGPSGIVPERLCRVELVPVAAPSHPLGRYEGRIPREELMQHVQVVLTERRTTTPAQDHNVISSQTWRLADLSAKQSFLLSGLGWGFVPLHVVERDLAEGRLTILRLEDQAPASRSVAMFVAYRGDAPPGRAGRWMIDKFQSAAAALDGSRNSDDAAGSVHRVA